ncbi:MAG TPA: urease accessory protein UreJ [Acidobacteria bacterium]|nr:urease accessory protein UreJ [Acidobacteriota bacterium]
MRPRWIFLALGMLACFPAEAFAHVDRQAGAGFLSGLLHPVFGLDHFLAMLSVGIVSAQLGGKKVFIIPAVFVLSMVGGAVAGLQGQAWPLSEAGIALSVVVLGAAIALVRENGGGWGVMPVVMFFGSLHGHAHGLELPQSADPVYYAAGFVTSTTLIHLLGVGIGHGLTRHARYDPLLRHMGSVMAGMGLMILLRSVAS